MFAQRGAVKDLLTPIEALAAVLTSDRDRAEPDGELAKWVVDPQVLRVVPLDYPLLLR